MKQKHFREDHSLYSLASDRGSIWTHFWLTLRFVLLTSTLGLLTWNKHLYKIYGKRSGSHTFIQDVKTYSNPNLSLSFAWVVFRRPGVTKYSDFSFGDWELLSTQEGKQTGLPSDSHLWRRWSQVGGRRQNISGSMWAPWLILVAFNRRTCFTLFGLIERKCRGSLELTHPRHPHIDELSSVWLTAPSFSVLADSLRKIGSFFFFTTFWWFIHTHSRHWLPERRRAGVRFPRETQELGSSLEPFESLI